MRYQRRRPLLHRRWQPLPCHIILLPLVPNQPKLLLCLVELKVGISYLYFQRQNFLSAFYYVTVMPLFGFCLCHCQQGFFGEISFAPVKMKIGSFLVNCVWENFVYQVCFSIFSLIFCQNYQKFLALSIILG